MATIDPMAQLFDPALMAQYRALLEPPPEAKRQAGMDALLALGLGLLGNRSPYFGVALGNAGMGAMAANKYALDTARQNRMGEIQGAMGLRKLSKDINQEQARDQSFEDWLATQPPEKRAAARAAYLGNPEAWAKFMAEQQFPKPTEFQQETGTLSPDEQRKALLMRHNLVPKPVLPTFTEGAWVDPNKLSYTPVPEAQQFKLAQSAMSAPRQMTLVNAYAPASEEAQKDFMKELRTSYAALRNAGSALENIEAAKKLVPAASGFMGPGGETLLNAAKFLNNRIGTNIRTEGVKSAEELRSRVFFNIMDNLKKMDAQPSELQQKIMMEALSNLGTDPNAMPAILDAFGDAIRSKVRQHNADAESSMVKGIKFPYNPIIKVPERGTPGARQISETPPQEGQRARSKSGKQMIYRGGRWEYE